MTFEELDSHIGGVYAPFLLSLCDGGDNELSVRIAPSYAGELREIGADEEPNAALRGLISASRPLLPDKKRVYEIVFERYIIYRVGNESFVSGDPNDMYTGKFLRIYEKSFLLDNIGALSDAQTLDSGEYYPGKWRHYEIVTQNHIISVISHNEPIVNVLQGT